MPCWKMFPPISNDRVRDHLVVMNRTHPSWLKQKGKFVRKEGSGENQWQEMRPDFIGTNARNCKTDESQAGLGF